MPIIIIIIMYYNHYSAHRNDFRKKKKEKENNCKHSCWIIIQFHVRRRPEIKMLYQVLPRSLVKQWHYIFPFHLAKYMEAYSTARDNCIWWLVSKGCRGEEGYSRLPLMALGLRTVSVFFSSACLTVSSSCLSFAVARWPLLASIVINSAVCQ